MRKAHTPSYFYELLQATQETIIGIIDLSQNYARYTILQIQQSPSPSTRKTSSHARLLWLYVMVGFSFASSHFSLLHSIFCELFQIRHIRQIGLQSEQTRETEICHLDVIQFCINFIILLCDCYMIYCCLFKEIMNCY